MSGERSMTFRVSVLVSAVAKRNVSVGTRAARSSRIDGPVGPGRGDRYLPLGGKPAASINPGPRSKVHMRCGAPAFAAAGRPT
jgi:hypothetical protein